MYRSVLLPVYHVRPCEIGTLLGAHETQPTGMDFPSELHWLAPCLAHPQVETRTCKGELLSCRISLRAPAPETAPMDEFGCADSAGKTSALGTPFPTHSLSLLWLHILQYILLLHSTTLVMDPAYVCSCLCGCFHLGLIRLANERRKTPISVL
ncbi:hypothetical protein VTO42DRAFT_6523 [Malbranchea cinnamomea]